MSERVASPCSMCGSRLEPGEVHICYDPDAAGCPTLGRFMRCDDRVRMVIGPVGSGKSSGCCMEILRRATEQRRGPDGLRHSRWAIIRNTYPELRDTTRATFSDWLDKDGHGQLGKWHESSFTFHMKFDDVRAEVLFRALDEPKDIRKLLSLELTGAYINECREVNRGVFDLIQTRIGRYPSVKDGGASWTGLWADTNPPDTDHWIYKLFEEERPDQEVELPDGTRLRVRFSLFKQPSGLSPQAENLKNLERGYYQIKSVGKSEDWIKIYLRGEYGFVVDGRPVYPEYQDSVHCKDVVLLPAPHPILMGGDWGRTPAIVLAQRDPRDGQLQVFHEFTTEDMGAVTFCRDVATYLKREHPKRPVRGWADPAGCAATQVDDRTPFDVAHEAGLPLDPAPTNDFMRRRESVAGLLTRLTSLARPALAIDPRCKTLRKAMQGGYQYARIQVSGDDKFRDVPDKNRFSHPAEALQYLACGEGEDDRAIHGTSEHRRVRVSFKSKRAVKGGFHA